MKKRYILACLLALLLCACERKPPAVTTDTQPPETTAPAQTTATTAAATTETVITRPETLVRYTAEGKDLSAIAEMEAIVKRDRQNVEFAITLTDCALALHGSCILPEGEETAVTYIRSVTHQNKVYPVLLTDEMICSLALFVTDDLILLGENAYGDAWSAAYFFYDGGACGYSGNELLNDLKNDDLIKTLSRMANILHFSLQDGVLRYEEIYFPSLRMTADDCLPYRFGGDVPYSASGTVTLAEKKLTITEDTVTTVAEELEPVWRHAGMDSFEDYVDSVADSMPLPSHTVSFTTEAIAEFLEDPKQRTPVFDLVCAEDNGILLRVYYTEYGEAPHYVVTRITYHGKSYEVYYQNYYESIEVLYLPDFLVFGKYGANGPASSYSFFYEGGMCGYTMDKLLPDGVNDAVMEALRAQAVKFTVENGTLHYAKYYDLGVCQAIPHILEYADRPDALYSEEGTLSFAGGKLTMTVEKTTTMEEFFAERDYPRYGVTNFADLMRVLQDTLAQASDFRRYTVAMNSDAISSFLLQMQRDAVNGEPYPSMYEIVAEEDPKIILLMQCDSEGYHSLSRVQYHENFYSINLNLLGGTCMEVFCLPNLLVFGEAGASAPGSRFFFLYDGGMCGYDGEKLRFDDVNDAVVTMLRAPSLKFTVKDGVLHYAKYYHYGIVQAPPMVLEFADTPDELYSEEGTLTFHSGKLTMTLEKTTTIEDFAERYYERYNVTNFADLMQAMKNE